MDPAGNRGDAIPARRASTIGAPAFRPNTGTFETRGGVGVQMLVEDVLDWPAECEALIDSLDSQRGMLMSSNYEYPGRYAQWTVGFVNPPLCIEGWGRVFKVTALNQRGQVCYPWHPPVQPKRIATPQLILCHAPGVITLSGACLGTTGCRGDFGVLA
jgi:hypothetical protein